MIKIDAETGKVSWDSYQIFPSLSLEDFKRLYPNLSPVADERWGEAYTIFTLPKQKINSYQVGFIVRFFQNQCSHSGIYLTQNVN